MKRPAFHLFTAVLACLFLTQCGVLPGSKSRTKNLQKLGYEPVVLDRISGDQRYSGIFLVNGTPQRFLIDSGANRTDLDETRAVRAGLRLDNSIRIVTRGALGREIHSGRGFGSLQIGPMILHDFPFTIAPTGTRKTSTSSYAGQVGLDALSATGALIDIPEARMWVPGERSHSRRAQHGPQLGLRSELGHKVLPLATAGRLPHLVLKGSLNGRVVTWVVDTGAEVSVMATESFESFGIPSRTTNSRMIDASGDRIPLKHARLHNLSFGEVNISVFDISVAPLGPVRQYFLDGRGRPVDGILGMDFLTTGRALLDSGSGILYMGLPR